MAEAFINPNILTWARKRAGLTVPKIAQKLRVKPTQVQHWESGEKRPTFKQAQNFASKTYIPFGYLYLEHPPKEVALLRDAARLIGVRPENIKKFAVTELGF